MKTLLLASALAALAFTPAHGAALKSRADIPELIKWEDTYSVCVSSGDVTERAKACRTLERLDKKMEAKGYQLVGHGLATVRSKDGEHNYRIEDKRLDKAREKYQKDEDTRIDKILKEREQ
jgi:hypothetical protein